MKNITLSALCGALTLTGIASIVWAQVPTIIPFLPEAQHRLLKLTPPYVPPKVPIPTPDGVDLALAPIGARLISRNPLRFEVYAGLYNLGHTTSTAGTATGGTSIEIRIRPGSSASDLEEGVRSRIVVRALAEGDMQVIGFGGGGDGTLPSRILAGTYNQITFRLIRGTTSLQAGSTFTDANNANNTVTLTGDQLVRQLRL